MPLAEADVVRLSLAIACGIVALGSLTAAALVIVFLQRRLQRRLRESPEAPADHSLSLLMYAGSAVFWPVGVALTATLPEARTARTCGVIVVLHMTAIALATCGGVAALAAYADIWK